MILILFVLFLASCGLPNVDGFESLLDNQPKVMTISPSKGEEVDAISQIKVVFSQAVKKESISEESFIVGLDTDDKDEVDLKKDIKTGDLKGISGNYDISPDNREVIYKFKDGSEHVGKYVVFINDLVLNELNVPLNQNRGKTPEPFLSYFFIKKGDSIKTTEEDVTDDANNQPSSVDETESESVKTQTENGVELKYLVINEFIYDVVGKDTEGDLFIELYGTKNAQIGGSVINLVGGEDGKIAKTITLPSDAELSDSGIYLIADSVTGQSTQSHIVHPDFMDNFDPQNGPDAIQIVGVDGKLWDAVAYGPVTVEKGENGLLIKEGNPTPLVKSGQSLSRIEGVDDGDNFKDFKIIDIPTPGSL